MAPDQDSHAVVVKAHTHGSSPFGEEDAAFEGVPKPGRNGQATLRVYVMGIFAMEEHGVP